MFKKLLLPSLSLILTYMVGTSLPICEITPQLVIDPGTSVAGSYSIGYANTWSGAIPGSGVAGGIVLVDDGNSSTTATNPFSITYALHDLCDTAINESAIMGKIAVIVRGACTFQSKAEKPKPMVL